jgi:hypothetical protein
VVSVPAETFTPLLKIFAIGGVASANHPNPLRRRGDGDLTLQHRHRVAKRAHPVPSQLHVEVEAAADDVYGQ